MLKHLILLVAELPVSFDTLNRVGAIVIPVLAGIVGIKTYKIIFALWPVTRSTSHWESPSILGAMRVVLVSPLAILVAACLIAYFFLWRRLLNHRLWLRVALIFLFPLIFLPLAKFVWIEMKRGGQPVIESSWTHQVVHVYWDALSNIQFLFGMYRADIFFLAGYTLLSALALSVTPIRWRRAVFSLFICTSVTILAVAGLELAHYLETGMNATASMLMYFLDNAGDLWAMVSDEVNWKTIAAMSVPPLLIVLSPALIQLTGKDFWTNWRQDRSVFATGKVIWPVLLIVILAPFQISPDYVRLRGNIVLNIGHDLLIRSAVPAGAFEEGEALRHAAVSLEFVPTASTRRLNIVIVLLESVRANATGVYDPSLQNTPFLRDLSKKSLVADQMYAVIPRTSAAWVSVLNGTYPGTNSALMYWAYQEARKPTFASLPRLLRKHGYTSAFFVPTSLSYENEGQLLSNMGFDRIVSEKDYGETPYEQVSFWGLEDRVMLGPIFSWVDAQRRDNSPFLLTVMTNVGHEMYNFPSTWKRQNFAGGENENYNNYLNCIAYIDDFLKQLFTEFQGRGLFQNTIFFVLGDHGDSFGEHGTRERALSMYEEALHIPMIIFAPSLFPDGGKINAPRQQGDIFPTVADMLGFSIKGGPAPGLSLLRDSPKDRELYYGSFLEEVAIGMRKGSRKYIYKFDSAPMEVFDLAQDPDERHDLAGAISETEARVAENQMLKWNGAVRALMMGSER